MTSFLFVFGVTAFLSSLLLSPAYICAQDIDPPKSVFSTTTASRSLLVRQQPRTFTFGWGTGVLPPYRDTSEALHINTILMVPYIEVTTATNREYRETPDSTRLIYHNYHLGAYGTGIAMQFDPTEENTISDWNSFVPRTYDTSGAAFGFANKHAMGIVPHDSVMTSSNPDLQAFRENYNRYLLFSNDFLSNSPGGSPLLVLAQPAPSNHLMNPLRTEGWFKAALLNARKQHKPLFLRDVDRYRGANNGIDSVLRLADSTYFQARGDSSEWYIAVNLRRWRNDDQDAIADTSAVLSLRVPLVLRVDTVFYHATATEEGVIDSLHKGATTFNAYALFDSTATLATDTVHHHHYGFMDNTLAPAATSEFLIRKGMLPNPTLLPTQARPDITLSAHFWLPRLIRNGRFAPVFDYHDITNPNKVSEDAVSDLSYIFRPLPAAHGLVLDTVVVSVGLEVYYYGNVDLGLDWCRFENRVARHILRGAKDQHILQRTQALYDTLDTHDSLRGRAVSLYKHYFTDETPAPFWRLQRHVYRLLEDAGVCENDHVHTPHHNHQTAVQEAWKGWFSLGIAAAPFYRFGAQGHQDTALYNAMPFRTMNLKLGYRGAYLWAAWNTPLKYSLWNNSATPSFDYEAGLLPLTPSLYNAPDTLYTRAIADATAAGFLQAVYEHALILKLRQSSSAYYGNIPFWVQLWPMCRLFSAAVPPSVLAQLPAGRTPHVLMFQDRPHTAEEMRFEIWTALALGAKGLTYFSGGSALLRNADSPVLGQIYAGASYLGLTRQYRDSLNNIKQRLRTDTREGGDFLDTNDILRAYIHLQEISERLGVDSSRIYVGTTSVRSEIKRQHDFVDTHQKTLMALQLQGVYCKGFKLIQHSRNSGVNFGDFFDTTTANGSRFRVRRIHDRFGNAWTGADEHFADSTFFLVSLLADTARSTDSVYYIAVVNRRTNPTFYYPRPGGTDLGDSIKFFSGAEFDSLRSNHYLDDLYAEPDYAQEGSREITLPLRFQPVTTDGAFTLLRIRALDGTLDTVLAESSLGNGLDVSVKLKPGEGKLLKVSYLFPGTIPEGSLLYSNQRKMVCVPDEVDSSKVRYHIVYHRIEEGHNEVFYRRSRALQRNSDEANIVWGAEIPISRMVIERVNPPNIGIPHYGLNCAYPSLVVRHDAEGKKSLHIVYACQHPDTSVAKQFIIEHQTALTTLYPPVALQSNFVLDTVTGRSLEEWGTPTIGAVAHGNFYAWADSLTGIVVAYKASHSAMFGPQDTISFSPTASRCQHPSLASYTRTFIGEHTTALVWQEDGQIYYANPYIDTAGALRFHRFPVSSLDDLSWLQHNADTTVLALCASSCTFENRLPVVYRGVETGTNYYDDNAGFKGLFTMDRVAWEAKRTPGNVASMIASRWIDLLVDTNSTSAVGWQPWMMMRSGVNKLYSIQPNSKQSFYAPDIAQGRPSGGRTWLDDVNTFVNNSDSAFVLSFYGFASPSQNGTPQWIWHLPLSYSFSMQGSVIYPLELGREYVIDPFGLNPHQAARPTTEASSWWMNRRVFEQTGTPQIASSAQYYFRAPVARGDLSLSKAMTFTKLCGFIGVIEPMYNDVAVRFEPKPGGGAKSIDTLVSEAFPMSGVVEVSFYVIGSDSSLAKVELLNLSTNARTPLPIVAASDTTVRLVSQSFSNGGGQLYRLEFIRRSAQAEYSTAMIAGRLPLTDSSGALIGYAKEAVEELPFSSPLKNLAVGSEFSTPGLHAYVYPNPVKESVAISVYHSYSADEPATPQQREDHLVVRIISMLGSEIKRFQTRAGLSVEFPVKQLAKGVYFVRVEQEGNSQQSGTTSFVVE